MSKEYHKPRLVYVDSVPQSARPSAFNGKWGAIVMEFARSGHIYAMVETGGVAPGNAATCMRAAIKRTNLEGIVTVMQRKNNAYLVLKKKSVTTVVAGEGIRDAS